MFCITVAEPPNQREQIYRLRYHVNAVEQERNSGFVNHEQRTVVDPLDESSTHLGAWDEDKLTGAVRISPLRAVQLDYMSCLLPPECAEGPASRFSSMTSRLLVSPGRRGTALAIGLARETYRWALRNRIVRDYIVCSERMAPLFRRLGYRSLNFRGDHPEAGEVHAFSLDLYDAAHLQNVRSPFLEDLSEYLDQNQLSRAI